RSRVGRESAGSSESLTVPKDDPPAGHDPRVRTLARGRLEAEGKGEVEVYAEAHVSLNGRPRQLLIDPRLIS
ncbi:MAG: hypothetical protein AAFU79_32150, partial [Myxococcota bacterium]